MRNHVLAPYIKLSEVPCLKHVGREGSLRGNTSVYLVAQDPEEREESAPLELYFQEIFESELEAWHTDQSAWPEKRDIQTFLAWFEVEAQSLVWDLEEARLVKEAL